MFELHTHNIEQMFSKSESISYEHNPTTTLLFAFGSFLAARTTSSLAPPKYSLCRGTGESSMKLRQPRYHVIHWLSLQGVISWQAIGHFRVLLCLCFKTSPSAKPFIWKWVLHAVSFFMQINVIFIRMVSLSDSLWNRGTRELGNHVDYWLLVCRFMLTVWTSVSTTQVVKLPLETNK